MAETAVDNAKYRRLRANGVPHAQAVAMAAVTPTADFSPPSSLATDLELSSALAVKAPLVSPAFTGAPTKNGSPVQSQADVAGAFGAFATGDTTTPQTWTGVNWHQGKRWDGNANQVSFSSPWSGATSSDDVRAKIIEWFGQGGPVTGTPQARGLLAKYFNPTTQDSAQADSAGVILTNTGTPFTQTKNVVGFEGDALVQGANIASNKVSGLVAASEAQDTASIANAFPIYVAAKGARDAGTSITTLWAGVYVENPATGSAGTIADTVGVYSKPRIQTETGVIIGITQATTSANQKATPLFVIGPGGGTAQPTAVFQVATGQTSNIIEARNTSSQATWSVNSSGQVGMKTGAGSISYGSSAGPMMAIGNITTAPTVNFTGGTGGFLYVESGALKFRGGSGTVTVVAAA